MSDEKRNYPQPKETLRARYFPKEGFYQLLFEVDGKTKVVQPLYEPDSDSNMKSIILEVAKKLECYDISAQDIIQACMECNKKIL